MHFFCILEKRQVIKMMFKYELKKIFSKRMNKVLLAAVLVMTVIYSGMAIGSMSYTDADGQSHTGIDAGRLLAEDVNQWKGKLTTEKISEVINDYKTLSAKYQDDFVVACFVSIAMGTSVGTITLIVPIAAAVSDASGFGLPLCIGSVMGGAMFGDNLSFISDTTIAACNGQGCQMKDKFRENFFIALPAAVMTLVVIAILSFRTDIAGAVSQEYHLLQIVPYILVLFGGIAGINVFVVIIIGIISGTVIMLATGSTAPYDLLTNMGSGASGMFETCMVAVLVAAMCALIREYGGFDALLSGIYRTFRGKRGGLLGRTFDIGPKHSCYWLDSKGNGKYLRKNSVYTGYVFVPGDDTIWSADARTISAVHELGHDVSAFNIPPYLLYPMFLLVSSLVAVFCC